MWALQRLRKLLTTEFGQSININRLLGDTDGEARAVVSQRADGMSPDPNSVLLPFVLRSFTSFRASFVFQSFTGSALAALVKGLPEALQRQYEYEDPIVRGGKQLLHSPFFKV